MMRQAALDFLSDKVFYADMIDWVTRGVAEIMVAGESGVLLRSQSDVCMMTASDQASAHQMLEMIGATNCTLMVAHDDISVALVPEHFTVKHRTSCWSSVFLGSHLPEISRPDLRIETLGPQWLEVITANYDMDSHEYLRRRVDARVMLGAFRDQQLLGFIGQHSEGAMGILVVLDEHRRQGIAEYLLSHLTNRLLSQSRIAYDHIIVGNQASEALQRKLGFTISTRTLSWVSLGRDQPTNRTGPMA